MKSPAQWVTMITTMPIIRCSQTIFQGRSSCDFAIIKLRTARTDNPHIKLTIMPAERGSKRTGIMKVIAKKNFVKNVATVDPQICLVVCIFSDSSAIWIPKASENASAIAIVKIPARTTILEWVPE